MAKALEGIVLSERIALEQWDPSGETWVIFQRPSRWEAEQIARMQAKSELVWDSAEQGRVSQRDSVPMPVLESEMVAMCLVESNLPHEEDGELVFKPGVSCRAARKGFGDKARQGFYKAWYALPNDLADEIAAKLREWHPPFNWRTSEGED